jgi:hypothetical protein
MDHFVNRYFPAPSAFPVSSSHTTHKAVGHQMSLLAAPVVSLLFFSAFAVAAISAPGCSPTWEWVCMLFLEGILMPLPDLMAFGV